MPRISVAMPNALAPLLCAALAGLAAAPRAASAQDDFARPGFYLGLGGVAAIETFDGVDIDNAVGVNARLGYRISEFAAMEGHFEWTGDFEAGPARLDAKLLTTDFKLFALHDAVQPYVSVGMGWMHADLDVFGFDADDDDYVVRVGGGIDAYLTPTFGAQFDVSYVIPTGSLDELDYVSLGWGLFFRF